MAIIPTWCPPSREHWELVTFLWQFFPVVSTTAVSAYSNTYSQEAQLTLIQWVVSYYPMGKTSIQSRFNIPGKIGWATMEAPGPITLLYLMYSVPKQEGIDKLPTANYIMAGMFVCPIGSQHRWMFPIVVRLSDV